jgi:hypothetical protein
MHRVLDPSQPHWLQSSATVSTSVPDKSLSTPSYYTAPAPSTHIYVHEAVPVPSETPPSSGVGLPVVGGDTGTMTDAPESEDSVHSTARQSAAFLPVSRRHGTITTTTNWIKTMTSTTRSTQMALHLGIRLRVYARLHIGSTGVIRSTHLIVRKMREEICPRRLFGLRPAERNEVARLQPRLRMYAQDLLQYTMDIRTRLARAERIEGSPRSWGGGGGRAM